jgi:thioredoxin-dependent peroxiredoxin
METTMLKEGERAPDFEVPTDTGDPLRLSTLEGRNVVLFFFPKANTPG